MWPQSTMMVISPLIYVKKMIWKSSSKKPWMSKVGRFHAQFNSVEHALYLAHNDKMFAYEG